MLKFTMRAVSMKSVRYLTTCWGVLKGLMKDRYQMNLWKRINTRGAQVTVYGSFVY